MSRAAKIDENIYCPKCGKHEHQVKHGKNKSGSQKYHCNDCNIDIRPNHFRGSTARKFVSRQSGHTIPE